MMMMIMMRWRRRIMIVVIVFEGKLDWSVFFTFAPELKLLPHLKGIFVRFGFGNKIKKITFVRMLHKICLWLES